MSYLYQCLTTLRFFLIEHSFLFALLEEESLFILSDFRNDPRKSEFTRLDSISLSRIVVLRALWLLISMNLGNASGFQKTLKLLVYIMAS